MTKKLQSVARAAGGRPAKISRERILREVRSLGAGEFSTSRIAATLGVSQQALYYHFKSRDELLHALAIELAREFDVKPGSPKEWRTWLEETALRFFDFLVANPSILEVSNFRGLAAFGLPLMETAFQTLKGAGYSIREASSMWDLVSSLAFAKARLMVDVKRLGPLSRDFDLQKEAGQPVPLVRLHEATKERDPRKHVAGLLHLLVSGLPGPGRK